METEDKNSQTDFGILNTRKFGINIHNLKKIQKKGKSNFKKLFRNENREQQYKISGTQTENFKTSSKYSDKLSSNIFNKKERSNSKKVLLTGIQNLCDNIYGEKYKSNTYRIKLRENIIKSIDDYIFNDLKKNVLFPKMLNIRTNKKSKLKKIKFFSHDNKIKKELIKEKEKEIIKEKEEEKKKEVYNYSNKMNIIDLVNNTNVNSKIKNRNSRVYIYKYEDYANNNIKYNHPQIYTLNNTYKQGKLFPKIKPHKSFLGFAHLIPEKKEKEKDFDKQMYQAYKTMKNKVKNEIGIQI